MKEINAQLDALLLGGELKQNSMRTNMGAGIARQLRDKLAAMTAERDALATEKAAWLQYTESEWETVQHTASRCAEIAEHTIIKEAHQGTALALNMKCKAIAAAIRKEFNL